MSDQRAIFGENFFHDFAVDFLDVTDFYYRSDHQQLR